MTKLRDPKLLLALLGMAALAILAPSPLNAQAGHTFLVPAQGHVIWQAEDATRGGNWIAHRDPAASGGAYLESPAGSATLTFPIHLDRPTAIQLRPVWWRIGERKPSRRFPYPMERLPGPDAAAVVGRTVFFTAPTVGRVGFLDADTSAPIGRADIGGYLTDIVADQARGVLYVANAQWSSVAVLDAATHQVVATIHTPAEPWSLALSGHRLFVACRGARCVAVIDTARREVVATVPLPAEPVSVQVTGGGLIVRFQQQTYDVRSLDATVPDRLQYRLGNGHRSVRWKNQKTFESPSPGVIRVLGKTATASVDTRAVTSLPPTKPGDASQIQPPVASALAVCSGAAPVGDRVLFTSPANGRVGVIDAKTDKLEKTLDVGGTPVDIAVDAGRHKAYVADGAGARLVVIDTAKMTVARSIKVPAGPCSLEYVDTVAWQRPYLVPPEKIGKLFVACWGAKQLAVVDSQWGTVTKILTLPSHPRRVGFVAMPNVEWWPLLADDRIAIDLTPRVAVEPEPMHIDRATLAASLAPTVAESSPSHATATVGSGNARLSFRMSGDLTIAGPKKQTIDVSAICDPQLAADRPLAVGDTPGSITYSIDGGYERDWSRNLWIRPDNDVFLVAGTDEYWRWNAPRIVLGAGDHKITVRARGWVDLDGLQVERTAQPLFAIDALPEPRSIHSKVPSPSYQGVFYNKEPVRFTLEVTPSPDASVCGALPVRIETSLRNYMDEVVATGKPIVTTLPPTGTFTAPLNFSPADTGRFTLTLTVKSPAGDAVKQIRFVRVPKLEHPRLFFRKADLPAIEKRIAAHPKLFRRYADWLARQCTKGGKYPHRFLPPGLTSALCASAAPPGTKDPHQEYGWRMYELGMRLLAMEFAARFIPASIGVSPADHATLEKAMKPLLEQPSTTGWVQYHYHGPFFPGAAAGMVDMVQGPARKDLPLLKQLRSLKGDMNVYSWTLETLEEPLTPKDRALIYKMATMHTNFERYFMVHCGTRGGTWWQNPWSWCYCPTQGIFLSFLFTRNFLGEERIFDKPFFRGYLTFMDYMDPIADKRHLLPELTRPSGEPWRWILTATCQEPSEHARYPWDQWVRDLDGNLPAPEDKAVDKLFSLEGWPMHGPFQAAPHHFYDGVAIPLALALGWYHPDSPKVQRAEMPPSTLFNVDGVAALRSGWDDKATEVQFWCGARDHTARHEAGHFTVVKSGQFLLGTPALWGDDGNDTPAWGNTVVFGDKWLQRWQLNLQQPRAEEYALVDRFSPLTWTYISRDRKLCGYKPAENGWGGGIDLHGHTEDLLVREGKIIAYETSPEFDYVAGDATDAWPASQARQHVRQIVFLKPTRTAGPPVIVVHDRVKLGPAVHTSAWIAATGPKLMTADNRFMIEAGDAAMRGVVLLPREAHVSPIKPAADYQWKGQQCLEVTPAQQSKTEEYLVVMTTGGLDVAAPDCSVAESPDAVAVTIKLASGPVVLRFRRTGPIGASINMTRGGRTIARPLATTIEDTYARWSADPRYKAWTTEPRFDFVIPARDRKR